jgi:hypothetical protein
VETANVRHVSSFNLGVCSPPFSPIKSLKGLTLTLQKGVGYVSNKVWVERKQIIRRNGTGKYTVKALAFHPRRRTSPSLSMVA